MMSGRRRRRRKPERLVQGLGKMGVSEVKVKAAGKDAEVPHEPGRSVPAGREPGHGVKGQGVKSEHGSSDGCGVGDEVGRRRRQRWSPVADQGQEGVGFEIRDDEGRGGGRAPEDPVDGTGVFVQRLWAPRAPLDHDDGVEVVGEEDSGRSRGV